MNYKTFCKQHGIWVTVKYASHNPHMHEGAWTREANHWSCTLFIDRDGTRRKMTVPFTTGSALKGAPWVDDVLESLCLEARSIEHTDSFEEWATDLGFDPTRNQDRVTYEHCKKATEQLRRFLGDLYTPALDCEEA